MVAWVQNTNTETESYSLFIDVENRVLLATLVCDFNGGTKKVWYDSGGGFNIFIKQPKSIQAAKTIILKVVKEELEKEIKVLSDKLCLLNDFKENIAIEVCDECRKCHWYCADVLEECKGETEVCHEYIEKRHK